MRLTSKLALVPLFAVTFWFNGCTQQPDGDATQTTEDAAASGTSSTVATDETSAVSASSETAESSSTTEPPNLLPQEQAAVSACDALGAVVPIAIPHGEGPYLETGFRLGNEFPYGFEMDSNELNAWGGDYYCYPVGPPQEASDDYWMLGGDWRDDDGEIHVYMATADVDAVFYSGSDETNSTDVPGSPLTDAIEFDVSALCPELPRIWIPDVNGHPENAGTICMHQTSPIAEAFFVWVP